MVSTCTGVGEKLGEASSLKICARPASWRAGLRGFSERIILADKLGECFVDFLRQWRDSRNLQVLNTIARILYYAMVHSHLAYFINIYGCANSTNLQCLRIKQKEAVRIINNVGFCDQRCPYSNKMVYCRLMI
jgi:hypothetical protein